MVTFTATGGPQGASNLRRSATLIVVLSSNRVEASAQRIVYSARALAPSLTGALRRSIDYSMSRGGTKAYVGIAAGEGDALTYWRFIEFGTHYVPSRPFFRPAAEAEAGRFGGAMTEMGRQLELSI